MDSFLLRPSDGLLFKILRPLDGLLFFLRPSDGLLFKMGFFSF